MGGIANMALLAMVILMARTKNAPKKGNGSGEGTSRGRCADKGKGGRRDDTWAVRKAKRRKDQAQEELEEWQESIQHRVVTCER